MSIGCDCNVGLSNTGRPGCVPLFSIVSSMILVPIKATDGTKNGIDLNAALPVWADLINEADASKRWFPVSVFENVEMPKADSLFEEAASGKKAFLRQGVRSFAGELWAEDSTPTYLGKLVKSRCVEFGAYFVDVNGTLIGSEVDGYLYPIAVDAASWDPKFAFATDATVQKIMLGFDFDRLFDESTMYQITEAEAGINFGSLNGLLDVEFTHGVGSASFISVTFDAKLSFGTALNKILYTGATLITDWTVTNDTSGLPVTVTSVLEGPDGTYIVGFAAQATTDIINIAVSRNGYEGSTKVTMP